MHTGDDDLRLADGLRRRRPGAVGHVYNVHGPRLFEYARGLVGDQDAAVDAVRAALLATGDRPDEVPGPERFEEWLRGLVRDECQGRLAPAARARSWPRPVVAGVAAAALTLTVGLMLLPDGPASPRPNAPVEDVALPPGATAPAPPPSPSRSARPSPRPSGEPGKARPAKRRAARGRLAIGAGGCRGVRVAGLPRTCRIVLTARGGPVRWSVRSAGSRGGWVRASGGGTLARGASTAVTVAITPAVGCYLRGGGSGSVSFSPGGTAGVSYTCWRR